MVESDINVLWEPALLCLLLHNGSSAQSQGSEESPDESVSLELETRGAHRIKSESKVTQPALGAVVSEFPGSLMKQNCQTHSRNRRPWLHLHLGPWISEECKMWRVGMRWPDSFTLWGLWGLVTDLLWQMGSDSVQLYSPSSMGMCQSPPHFWECCLQTAETHTT